MSSRKKTEIEVPSEPKTIQGFRPSVKNWPADGWFGSCTTCENPTSHYIVINKLDKFYCCRRCQKKQLYRRYQFMYTDFDVESY